MVMQYRTVLPLAAMMSLIGVISYPVYAQTYPSKPIKFVTSQPGGGADTAARIIARGISPSLGQQVIVDNRPPIIVPGDTVAKAAPDGYTLLVFGGTHWLQPFFRDDVPYDPIKDFAPNTLATYSPAILVVHPALPVKTVADLIALAKKRPGAINYGSGGQGSQDQLAGELFKSMAGINLVQITYKGGAPAMVALASGEIQVMFTNATVATAHIKAGRIRAIAVASPKPSVVAPGLPTVASYGLTGFQSASILGVFAPAKTPDAIVKRLNQEIVRYLKSPDAKEKFLASGTETIGSTPEELESTVKADMARLGKIIKEVGIKD